MGMAVILVMWHKPFELTFIPLSNGGSTWNLISIRLAVSKERVFENDESERRWTNVNKWHWPLIFTEVHVLI